MNGGLKYYDASFIMRSTDPSTLRIIDLWKFKSFKSNKIYIVEVEHFPSKFIGLKFYWKGVATSKHRYSLLTNDHEPRTIVMSCIQIMLYYYAKDSEMSFGFVAAPDIDYSHSVSNNNKRFRFYRRLMLSLFSSDIFLQVYDVQNSIYLLINKQIILDGKITLSQIENNISKMYEGDYILETND